MPNLILRENEIHDPASCAGCGLVVAIVCGVIVFILWNSLQSLPLNAYALTISELDNFVKDDERKWVSISDPVWLCESLSPSSLQRKQTIALFTDQESNILVSVTFDTIVRCDDLGRPIRGTVYRFTGDLEQLLERHNLDLNRFENAQEVYKLCEYCDRGNILMGLLCFSAMGIMGLLAYPAVYIMNDRTRQKRKWHQGWHYR